MSPRVLQKLTSVVLVTALLGLMALVAHSPGRGATLVATGHGPGEAGTEPTDSVVTGSSPSTDTTEAPPTSAPATATSTTVPPTTTRATSPPTTRGKPVPPTTTTVAGGNTVRAIGPPTGRLAVTLAVVRINGSGMGAGIATLAADGSDRRTLDPGNFVAPRWTPDGRFVVFTGSDSYSEWAVAATGGPLTQVPSDVAGAISPDGTRVVRSGGGPANMTPGPLMIQPIAETATGLVANGPATSLGVSGFNPVWSPDGHRILYSTNLGPTSGLSTVNADGTNARDLLVSAPVQALMLSAPGFSANGTTVSFIGSDNRAYFIGSDGQNLRPALPDAVPGISTLSAFSITWSSDHQSLAVLVNGANSLVVVDADRHLIASIHLPVQGFPIGISFDGSGQHIYYMGSSASPPQVPNLYSIALDGSGNHQLNNDGSILNAPAVLP